MNKDVPEQIRFGNVFSFRLLSFTFPEVSTVARQLTSAAKVMLLSGDQIHRTTTACIEVGCIGLLLCIDRNQNPFSIYGALKNALAVRQHNTAECAIIEGIGCFLASASFAIHSVSPFVCGSSKHARNAGSP